MELKRAAESEAFIFAGPVAAFTDNEFIVIDHPSGSVGVVRFEGDYYAVSNRCPHMGGPLCVGGGVKLTTCSSKPFEYETLEGVPLVRCPWHRWEYSIVDGTNAGNVTKTKIRTYPVKVEGENVYVGRSAIRHGRPETQEVAP
ncbi:nitrite reductase/ring-hydroxylating ferredoxin subunit [Hephaestia caeni]|uniref:Nitrite reductase/ring-hydroxylating ferredoxin subunit n=1 Tax=Hephaestia caeni TaxID=645617 RepID=A0A397PC32_9SPHN|nr:Rieske 2Fe-2S domain-containing protein [Hephaestia caeni]RIA45499.1 nitrite reductase/ring-hydroxylating ferredoxin subunit [Hephaestia caeni]